MTCPCELEAKRRAAAAARGLGRWQRLSQSERQALPPSCFLDPSGRRYPVCPAGTQAMTCEGLLAARRRAVTQYDAAIEQAAIQKAKRMGCPWAAKAIVAAHRRRRAARAA